MARVLEVLMLIGTCLTGGVTSASSKINEADYPADVIITRRHKINEADYPEDMIITRDVCVIGGGAAGTYAAIGLRDLGKSVVVVERNDRLGGHTETYTDPITQGKVNIGVLIYHPVDVVRKFFARFDVPLTPFVIEAVDGFVSVPVDLRMGKVVTNYMPSDPTKALAAYAAELEKYPYLETGFDLPDPVPDDLLLPFGEFVKKYDLDPAVMTIFTFGRGLGDLLRQPTIYVLKNFNLDIVRDLQEGFVISARFDNSELYEKARAELGADALLLSRVAVTDRGIGDEFAKILVDTPSGRKLILARKVVLAIPPKLANLHGFDLDENERSLFGQFSNSAYYTGVLRNTGIPANTTIQNIGLGTLYDLPSLPGVYAIAPTGLPDLHLVTYGSETALSNEIVEADIIASLDQIRAAGIPIADKPEIATFASHTPFELTVPPSAIKAGFYRKLNALQGHRRTYYTGSAFHTHDSSLLWEFTRKLLPIIDT